MHCLIASLALAFGSISLTTAALCTPGGLLGVGDSVRTFPPDYQFILFGRNSSSNLLGVTSTNTGEYAPLTLADSSQTLFNLPRFELVNGNLRTYSEPYRYVTTQANPLLETSQLFTSPDGVGMKVSVVANNVTCNQASDYAVRFQGLVPVSSGSGSVNGSFAVGSTLASPILTQVLPLSKS